MLCLSATPTLGATSTVTQVPTPALPLCSLLTFMVPFRVYFFLL